MIKYISQSDTQCHNCGEECPEGSFIYTTEDELYCVNCGEKEIELEDLKKDNILDR